MEKEALSRVTPPEPITDKRRKLSISDKGLVWSKMVESRLRLKNSEIAATKGLGFTRVLGVISISDFASDIFSLIDLSSLKSPTRKAT